MAVNETGRYAGSVVDEIGNRVNGGVDESGVAVFGAAVAAAAAFQADAFENDAFQVVAIATVAFLVQPSSGEFFDMWTLPEDDYWATDLHAAVADDAIPAIIAGPPAGENTEEKAAQDYSEAYQWDSGQSEDYWANVYGFPDQVLDSVPAALFPPDVTDDFQATALDTSVGQDIGLLFPDPDPSNDQTYDPVLEVVAELFPPDVTDDFHARQLLPEQPWFPAQETEDYQNDTTVDTSWSMDFASGDEITIATQPLTEFDAQFYAPDETQDYAQDSTLDVTAAFFPPAVTDDGYIAAQDLPDQQDFTPPDWEYSPFLDELEGYLSPNDAFDTTIATQPLAEFGAEFYAADETQDYANDAALDITGTLFQPDVTDEFQAAQYGTPDVGQDAQNWPDADPTNDQPLVDGAIEALLAPPLFAPDEVMAAQLGPEVGQDQALWPPDDYTNDQPLVDGAVEAFQSPNDAFDVTIAAADSQPDQQQPEDLWQPDALVEQNEYLALAVDDGYIAADLLPDQQFAEEPFFPDLTDDGAVAAFQAGDDGYIAALDLPDETYYPADETENYASLSALDSVPAVLFPPAPASGGPFPIKLEGQWDPTIKLEGQWDPTITLRGQWDPTITLEGQWDTTITLRGQWRPTLPQP